jgi:hypothetical protein
MATPATAPARQARASIRWQQLSPAQYRLAPWFESFVSQSLAKSKPAAQIPSKREDDFNTGSTCAKMRAKFSMSLLSEYQLAGGEWDMPPKNIFRLVSTS